VPCLPFSTFFPFHSSVLTLSSGFLPQHFPLLLLPPQFAKYEVSFSPLSFRNEHIPKVSISSAGLHLFLRPKPFLFLLLPLLSKVARPLSSASCSSLRFPLSFPLWGRIFPSVWRSLGYSPLAPPSLTPFYPILVVFSLPLLSIVLCPPYFCPAHRCSPFHHNWIIPTPFARITFFIPRHPPFPFSLRAKFPFLLSRLVLFGFVTSYDCLLPWILPASLFPSPRGQLRTNHSFCPCACQSCFGPTFPSRNASRFSYSRPIPVRSFRTILHARI